MARITKRQINEINSGMKTIFDAGQIRRGLDRYYRNNITPKSLEDAIFRELNIPQQQEPKPDPHSREKTSADLKKILQNICYQQPQKPDPIKFINSSFKDKGVKRLGRFNYLCRRTSQKF